MTKEIWAHCYNRLTVTFNKPANLEQMRIYYEALADVPDARMEQAICRVIRLERSFPVPAVLREACDQIAAAAYREAGPNLSFLDQPISDEQTAELLALIRATKVKLFGQTLGH